MKKSVLTLSLLMTLAGTQAFASTTDLTITGTITPSACTPTLSNGGVVDYGRLNVEGLEETAGGYNLPDKALALTVACGASTPFALIATDNRRDSTTNPLGFGMGLHETQPIGTYSMIFTGAELDGQQHGPLTSQDGGTSWSPIPSAQLFDSVSQPDYRVGFGATAPVAATQLNANMAVQASIAKDLSFNDDILLDGSSTLEIVYL